MKADGETIRKTKGLHFRVLPVKKGPGGKPGAKITMGRSIDNDIVVAEYSLSTHHCAFMYDATRAVVIDLGTRNGTLLNDKQLPANRSVRLRDRAAIKMGRLKFRFLMPASFVRMLKSMPQ
jgi:pSer/pThr/pTyr-binding forkhead associated (FHA) protein